MFLPLQGICYLALVHILVGCLILDIAAAKCRDMCKRQPFTEMESVAYTGQYLVYKGPWPYKDCQRLCRQYLECYNFIMEWLDDRHLMGYCGLIRGDILSSELIPVARQAPASSLYRKYMYMYINNYIALVCQVDQMPIQIPQNAYPNTNIHIF